jgi:thiol-disulfide isomerase/thioredoxin
VSTTTPSRSSSSKDRRGSTGARAGGSRGRRQATRHGRNGGRSPKTTALIVGVVVLFAALVYAAFGIERDAGPALEEVAGAPEVEGQELPAFTPEGDAAIGSQAPVIDGAGFDGTAATIGEGDELLVFLASWCQFCREELPDIVEWMEAGNVPEGVTVTAVVTGLDPAAPNWPPQDWLAREGYTGPVLVDDADGTVASAYGMSGTPFWVALDDGQVAARAAGLQGPATFDQLAQLVAG